MEIICERIKAERIKRNLSQQKLADAIGTSQQTVGRWEVGGARPDAGSIVALCRVLQVSADYLLGLTDNPTPFPEFSEEEMKEIENHAIHNAVPMTEDELIAILPSEMQEAIRTLIQVELIKAEEKKKKNP